MWGSSCGVVVAMVGSSCGVVVAMVRGKLYSSTQYLIHNSGRKFLVENTNYGVYGSVWKCVEVYGSVVECVE